MRVGRGDGNTDDADACGLRTVRHMRPEVESMCVHKWTWAVKRHKYTYAGPYQNPQALEKDTTIYPPCGPPHQANHHTCGRGCLPGTIPLTLPYVKASS
jgi:hypothetical protein